MLDYGGGQGNRLAILAAQLAEILENLLLLLEPP